jgi:hypothetical protein
MNDAHTDPWADLGLSPDPLPEGILEVLPSLTGDLASEGWQPGAPGHVTAETLRIDASCCREMECPECGHPGMQFHPWHLGGRYKAVAACPLLQCGCEIEC